MKNYLLLITLVITPVLVDATPYQQRLKARRNDVQDDYSADEAYDAEYDSDYDFPAAPQASCADGSCSFDRITSSDLAEMKEIYGDPFSTPSDDVRLRNLISGTSRP